VNETSSQGSTGEGGVPDGQTAPTVPENERVAAGKPAAAMVSEVAKAYYPRAVAAADSARSRSQAGYAIASAIAAALVAAGLFGGIDERSAAVKALGVLALAAWLLAGFMFIVAVSERRPDPGESRDPQKLDEHKGALAFVRDVMSDVKSERQNVEDRQRQAVGITALAMLLTVTTIVGVLIDQPANTSERGVFALGPAGRRAIDDACSKKVKTLVGTVDPDHLQEDFVPITVKAGFCRANKATLDVRGNQISAVALTP
jgi:hypothetical protein